MPTSCDEVLQYILDTIHRHPHHTELSSVRFGRSEAWAHPEAKAMDQKTIDRAIGRRLKKLRMNAGVTLNELAARAGVSRAMIARVEGAQSGATAALLGKLCAALDVSLSDVVALSEKRRSVW